VAPQRSHEVDGGGVYVGQMNFMPPTSYRMH
jgi:hypothetical protein